MIGKGLYIYKAVHIDPAGSPEVVASVCADLGLDWVALKIGDGSNPGYASFPCRMEAAVQAFKTLGIQVWGWHYVTGGNGYDSQGPRQDGDFAYFWCNRLGLDGYIIDAEGEYKTGFDPAWRATTFTEALKPLRATMPIALSSYRFPSLHQEFPWEAMLSGVDVHMPQLYWSPGKSLEDLGKSWEELKGLKELPFVPAGRCYVGDGYPLPGPDAVELTAWMTAVRDLGHPGLLFWALDYLFLTTHGAEEERVARYQAIKDFAWIPAPPPPMPKVVEVTATAALNLRSGPGTENAVIGSTSLGKRLAVEDAQKDTAGQLWYKIGAWVSGQYAKVIE
jgi:hypothetical protein